MTRIVLKSDDNIFGGQVTVDDTHDDGVAKVEHAHTFNYKLVKFHGVSIATNAILAVRA